MVYDRSLQLLIMHDVLATEKKDKERKREKKRQVTESNSNDGIPRSQEL